MTTPPTPDEAQLRQALAEREYALAETRGALKALALLAKEPGA